MCECVAYAIADEEVTLVGCFEGRRVSGGGSVVKGGRMSRHTGLGRLRLIVRVLLLFLRDLLSLSVGVRESVFAVARCWSH